MKLKRKSNLPEVPAALADVALIDGPTSAAARGIALSAFLALVREGKAPQPVLRAPRCTRWRMADVRAWLIELAAAGSDPVAEAKVMRSARRATTAAQASREAATRTGA